MKSRPILFSAPMVRALLAGTKTQTRRIVKPQPMPDVEFVREHEPDVYGHGAFCAFRQDGRVLMHQRMAPCPYGQPGDRLWVRETFRLCGEADATPPRDTDAAYRIWYEADAPHQPGFGKLRPGMFMPRWASRLTLEITGVRVERLQDISEADAKAEGMTPMWEPGCSGRLMDAIGGFSFCPAASAYANLWQSINGPSSWDANPFVWVVEFKRANGGGE